MVRTLSNRDKQICFLSTEANSILEICFWKHLRYEILEQDSGYRGRRCEGQMRLEELDKDRADDKKKKTAATTARYRITRTTTTKKKTSDFYNPR